MKINISFKKQDVEKEKTPTSNDLFSLLGNITDSCMARKARSPCEGLVVGTNARNGGQFRAAACGSFTFFPRSLREKKHFYRFIILKIFHIVHNYCQRASRAKTQGLRGGQLNAARSSAAGRKIGLFRYIKIQLEREARRTKTKESG